MNMVYTLLIKTSRSMATIIKRDSVIPVSTGTVPARGGRGGKPLRSDSHCFTETIEMAIHCFLRQVHFKAFDFFSAIKIIHPC